MYLGPEKNEYGTPVDRFKCDACGWVYTVCPALSDRTRLDEWDNCLGVTCASYDPARDADKLFDDGNVASFEGRKKKVRRGPPHQ